MSSLSDKLKALGVDLGAKNIPPPAKKQQPRAHIEDIVEGTLWDTPHGEVFVVEHHYPLDYAFGRAPILGDADPSTLAAWAKEPQVASIPFTKYAFLDTETSGLAGGTGTYAFMIGMGRFEDDAFRVAQLFMRDPSEELAVLHALEHFLAPCDGLVTFNGKSFDVPLLRTRYTTHAQPHPFDAFPHVDLLHLARKLWRARLPSRRLLDLEVLILGAYRTEEDVESWRIPTLYFNYLRGGDPAPLKAVFYHNEIDIVAMAALLNHVSQMLANPMDVEHDLDLLAIGKLHEDLGHNDQAQTIFRACLEHQRDEQARMEALERLSFQLKRVGQLDDAIPLWEEAAAQGELYAHIELAKAYEHTYKALEDALAWTQTAWDIIHARGYPILKRFEWQEPLKKRLDRLERKIEKQNAG